MPSYKAQTRRTKRYVTSRAYAELQGPDAPPAPVNPDG